MEAEEEAQAACVGEGGVRDGHAATVNVRTQEAIEALALCLYHKAMPRIWHCRRGWCTGRSRRA